LRKETMMRKRLLVLLAVAVILCLVSITACTPSPKDEDADGVWCYLPRQGEVEAIKVLHRKSFRVIVDDGDWTGTFTGSSEDYGTSLMHASGRGLFIGAAHFASVEVDGKTGGLHMDYIGERTDAMAGWQGKWTIIEGTGELEAIRGHGTWWGRGWAGDWEECGVIYYSVEELAFGDGD
jgi:hypothetical protein